MTDVGLGGVFVWFVFFHKKRKKVSDVRLSVLESDVFIGSFVLFKGPHGIPVLTFFFLWG